MKRLEAFRFVLKHNWINKWDVARDVTGPFSRKVAWFFDVCIAGWLECLKDMLGLITLGIAIVPMFSVGLMKGLIYSPVKVIFLSKDKREKLTEV